MINTRHQTMVVAIVVLCLAGGSLFGCSPAMRKKFVRDKKKAPVEDAVIPVLEPEAYSNELETVKTRYEYFYALLKVWHKDALTVLDDRPSDKQITYVLSQLMLQLEELHKIFDGPAAEIIRQGRADVLAIQAEYEQPSQFRNQDIIRKKIQRLRGSLIDPLAYENVESYLKDEDAGSY